MAFGPTSNTGAFTPTAAAANSNGLLGSVEQFGAFNTGATAPTTGLQGYFDAAGNWVKNNKELAKIGTDVIGGIASNLSPSSASKAQTAQAQAQTALVKQRAEEERIRQLWRQGRIA